MGRTPGIVRWVMVGTQTVVASTTALVHRSVSRSICWVVGLTTVGGGILDSISLNLSQFAFANCGLGAMGIAIGLTVILTIIGV